MVRAPYEFRFLAFATALLMVAALAGPGPAGAEELTLHLDPAATEVSFDVGATGHDVHGLFVVKAGEIHVDPATGAASGEIRVDAASAETGNGSRDKTMNQEVLETDDYPLFVFHAETMSGTLAREGASDVELHGQLEIHGASHPISLPAKVEIDGERLTATTSFPVPYVEWGMKRPGFMFLKVAPVVTVSVDAVGTLQEAAAGRTAAMEGPGGR